jgi:hypothetical protein
LAQRLPKPPASARNPTIVAGPTALNATSTRPLTVTLTWPPVANAERYQVLLGNPGNVIADFIFSAFVDQVASCVAGSATPKCVYLDLSQPFRHTGPTGSVYPHRLASGYDFTYRVVAVLPGGVISPPSPAATVTVK